MQYIWSDEWIFVLPNVTCESFTHCICTGSFWISTWFLSKTAVKKLQVYQHNHETNVAHKQIKLLSIYIYIYLDTTCNIPLRFEVACEHCFESKYYVPIEPAAAVHLKSFWRKTSSYRITYRNISLRFVFANEHCIESKCYVPNALTA